MDAQYFERIEKLLNRKFADEEKERLHRIQDVIKIANNDALWDIIIAMEYQRTFYENIPKQIEQSTADVLKQLSITAKKEVSIAQASLSKSVVEQAKKLSTREHIQTWLLWGTIVLVLTLIYGSLMAWLGYSLGVGKIQPLPLILQSPVGFLLAGILLCGGVYIGAYAAKAFLEVNSVWKKYMAIAVACICLGALVLCIIL